MTNAEIRARLAADALKEAPPPPTENVGGYPSYSANESNEIADITDTKPLPGVVTSAADAVGQLQVPSVSDLAAGVASPYNAVTTIGGIIAAGGTKNPEAFATGSRIASPVGTVAQAAWDKYKPFAEPGAPDVFSADTAKNVARDLAMNEFTLRVIDPGLSKFGRWAGKSDFVQGGRKMLGRHVVGTVPRDSQEAMDAADAVLADAYDHYAKFRTSTGQSVMTPDAYEQDMFDHMQTLSESGMLSQGQLGKGGLVEKVEPIVAGTLSGGGPLKRQKEAGDAVMAWWPRWMASKLGDPIQGPDQSASMAVEALRRGVNTAKAVPGKIMDAVEGVVGNRVVKLGPDTLDGISEQIALYAKNRRDELGVVKLDPESITGPINDAINLVQKSTGTKFNWDTLEFDPFDMRPSAGPGSPKLDPARMGEEARKSWESQAQGKVPAPTDYTWSNVKTLRSALGVVQDRIAGDTNRAQQNAILTSLRAALKGKLSDVLSAEDAVRGVAQGEQGSLRTTWDLAGTMYGDALNSQNHFEAQKWIEFLSKGDGHKVIAEVWPDTADTNTVSALKDLLGGEGSPYWNTLRRFKMTQLVEKQSGDPKGFLNWLTNPTLHSKDYWNTTLGKETYDRFLQYAELSAFRARKSLFQGEAGLGRRTDSGVFMSILRGGKSGSIAGLAGGLASGNVNPTRIATTAVVGGLIGATGTGMYFVGNRTVGRWLANAGDSKMFMQIARGKSLMLPQRNWLHHQLGLAVADATMGEEPDFHEVPATMSPQDYSSMTSRRRGRANR